MSPLSVDLRHRIIQAWQKEKARVPELAERFSVGTATVKRLIRQFRETGSIEPRPHGGGQRPKIPAEKLPQVQRLLEANPDWSVDELAEAYNRHEGTTVSRSTMSRTIARLGFTRKKESLVAKERDTERIATWREGFLKTVAAIAASRLVFVDETGTNTSMTREYARGPSGERVVGIVPRNRGTVLTVVGAVALDGVRAMMAYEGGTSAEAFLRFVHDALVPSLHPGDVVVLDNLGAHRAVGVREAIETAGARILYLPPYHPELNPIELAWAKLKALLKAIGARDLQALAVALKQTKDRLTPSDMGGWFRHCGYEALAQCA